MKNKEKQIDTIKNQRKRLETLTDKDDHKSNYKEIFENLLKKDLMK